ncbi:hypothetical protein ACKKBF_B21095 [Auxenochlorella protothecoides x Auxenochlorella symbiontica]
MFGVYCVPASALQGRGSLEVLLCSMWRSASASGRTGWLQDMRQTLWYRGEEESGVPGTTAACQDEVPSSAECSQGTLAGDSHGRGPGIQPQEARCDALLRQQSGSSYTSAASHASDLSAPGDPLPSPSTEASEEEGDTGPHGWKHVPFTKAETLATEAGLRTPDAACDDSRSLHSSESGASLRGESPARSARRRPEPARRRPGAPAAAPGPPLASVRRPREPEPFASPFARPAPGASVRGRERQARAGEGGRAALAEPQAAPAEPGQPYTPRRAGGTHPARAPSCSGSDSPSTSMSESSMRSPDSLLDVGHMSGRLGPRSCHAGPFRAVNPLALHIPFPHRGGDGGGGGSHPIRAASMGSLPAPHRRRASVEASARRGSWTEAPARRGSWTPGLAPPCAWVPCAVPEGAPDLERFLQSSTPVLPFHDDAELAAASLADVWMVYEESSAFGLATPRLGAPVGPCSAAYLPFLSALHTFAPEDAPPHGRPGAATADPGAADSWAARAAPSFSWTAEGHMTERVPLWEQVRKLRVREESAVWGAALADLHPFSWFAVAWYPLYSIPDSRARARFLTFHSLAPLVDAARAARARRAAAPGGPGADPPAPPPATLALPPCGLAWYTTGGGRVGVWTQPHSAVELPMGHALRRGALLLPGVVVEHLWSCGAVLSTPYPLSRGGPLSWDIQLEELWEGAERLASGAEARARGGGGADTRGKDGADAPRASGRFPACPDYHFFVSRRGAAHAH